MGLHPAVAAVRRGVRSVLEEVEPGDTVLVACSGGGDSLALLSATVFEGHKQSLRVIGATVDHGLQEGSAEHAARLVEQMRAMGVDETASVRVHVEASQHGPEAAARTARYEVLSHLGEHFDAKLILLGHTRDDQAETVLLGLARGSGARSLAGMRRGWATYRRPLLDVARADTVTACQVENVEFWEDPHNVDPAYSRARVRHRVLPVLEEELGPGIAEALARTAEQLTDDVAALEAFTTEAFALADSGDGIAVAVLQREPRAIASRVLRSAAVKAGCPPSELFLVHVKALVDLVEGRVRGEIQLPGHITAELVDPGDGPVVRFHRTA